MAASLRPCILFVARPRSNRTSPKMLVCSTGRKGRSSRQDSRSAGYSFRMGALMRVLLTHARTPQYWCRADRQTIGRRCRAELRMPRSELVASRCRVREAVE